jgi:hypothetical protein
MNLPHNLILKEKIIALEDELDGLAARYKAQQEALAKVVRSLLEIVEKLEDEFDINV